MFKGILFHRLLRPNEMEPATLGRVVSQEPVTLARAAHPINLPPPPPPVGAGVVARGLSSLFPELTPGQRHTLVTLVACVLGGSVVLTVTFGRETATGWANNAVSMWVHQNQPGPLLLQPSGTALVLPPSAFQPAAPSAQPPQ